MDIHRKDSHCIKRSGISGNLLQFMAGLVLATGVLFGASLAAGAESMAGQAQMKPVPLAQIFTFFFLMLGPIKIIGPFVKITQGADTGFSRRLAFRAIAFSSFGLLLAALLGESLLKKYAIPLPVLAITGGIILFLVALQTILQQFSPPVEKEDPPSTPTLSMAMTPLAFPTIVTPYGIAALIVFVALSPDMGSGLAIGGVLLGIMILNMIAMLAARHILRFLGVFLQILGAVLGIFQVALGLQIIIHSLKTLLT